MVVGCLITTRPNRSSRQQLVANVLLLKNELLIKLHIGQLRTLNVEYHRILLVAVPVAEMVGCTRWLRVQVAKL